MYRELNLLKRRLISLLLLNFIPLALISATSCTKHSSSELRSAINYFELTGKLIKQDQTAAKAARIYLPGTADPVANSDDAGNFSVRIEDGQINNIYKMHPNNAGEPFLGDFQIYFEVGDGDNLLTGRSGSLTFTDRGVKDLGTVGLDKAATVKGVVKLVGPTGDSNPAANITIAADRSETKSDKNGEFSLTGVPAGLGRLYTYSDDSAISTVEVTLPAGETFTLDFPLQAYAKSSVGGVLFAISQVSSEKPVLPGVPNQREFRVVRTGNARYIRFSDDKAKVTNGADWQEVPDQISYNFPQNGANLLYYQFANQTKEILSEVLSSSVAAYPFADSTGIVIGDGSGVVNTRRVAVHIDVPAAATEMRLSEEAAELGTASVLPFVKADKDFTFTFAIKRSDINIDNTMEETMPRTLYCQFKSADGTISPVYQAAVRLAPFPEDLKNETAFTIGDGSGKWAGWRVPITVKIPANAYEMRLWEEDKITLNISGDAVIKIGEREQLQSTFFLVAEKLDFIYQSTGFKTLFLQFRTKDGLTSTVFRQTLQLNTLKKVDYGFKINDGATFSTMREVTITLNPPDAAAAYKINEDTNIILTGVYTYLPTSKIVPFLTGGTGLRTINVQYFDAAGNMTALYTERIIVDPFNNDAGTIWIDGQAGNPLPVVTDPFIRIMVTPPTAAVPDGQMEVIRANMSLQGTPVCAPLQIVNSFVPITDHLDFLLVTPGPNAICVRFRNLAGDYGPYLMQSIIYDPFPINLGGVTIVKDVDNRVHVRDVVLNVMIPPRARQMRVANTMTGLATSSFRELEEVVDWYFAKPGPAGDDRYFEIFVQFITENGELSTVYTDNTLLDLFPRDLLHVEMAIKTRGTSTTDLDLTFVPPPAATGIKIADTQAGLATAQLLPADDHIDYAVSAITGVKTLYFKYVTFDNIESMIFQNSIDLTPTPTPTE